MVVLLLCCCCCWAVVGRDRWTVGGGRYGSRQLEVAGGEMVGGTCWRWIVKNS